MIRDATQPNLQAHDYMNALSTNVPLKTEFKPALRVLSRKPAAKTTTVIDPLTGLAKLVLEDEGDDDQQISQVQMTPEELRLKAQQDREEKQRRYDEARRRILGSGSSEPAADAGSGRGKPARGRGGSNQNRSGRGEASRSSNSQSGTKELFDPNYSPKPDMLRSAEGSQPTSGKSTPKPEDQIVRKPRGPDASGRGGFTFAGRRGSKS